MDALDMKYNSISANKQYTDTLLIRIKEIFNTAIKTGKYEQIYKIPELYDKEHFVLTGEIARINNILLITAEESRYRKNNLFLSDVNCFDEMYDKYIYTILMLRRIELYGEDDFSDNAYDFLIGRHISPEAVITILSKEYFEKKELILSRIYLRLESQFPDAEKLEWLSNITNGYKSEWALLKLAAAYLKYGQGTNALACLKSIVNPSAEIAEEIRILEGALT